MGLFGKKKYFSTKTYNRLKKKKINPRRVPKRINDNDNTYKIELPPNVHTYTAFNIKTYQFIINIRITSHGKILSHLGRMM